MKREPLLSSEEHAARQKYAGPYMIAVAVLLAALVASWAWFGWSQAGG